MSRSRTASGAVSPSVEKADDSPFELVPDPARATGAAALCLHGLTGSPHEVRPVAEALVARGVRARGIRMAGHGESTRVSCTVHSAAAGGVNRVSGAPSAARASATRPCWVPFAATWFEVAARLC